MSHRYRNPWHRVTRGSWVDVGLAVAYTLAVLAFLVSAAGCCSYIDVDRGDTDREISVEKSTRKTGD